MRVHIERVNVSSPGKADGISQHLDIISHTGQLYFCYLFYFTTHDGFSEILKYKSSIVFLMNW